MTTDPKPTTEAAKNLHAQVSPTRWSRMVKEAQERARIYAAVEACHADSPDLSWREARKCAVPDTPWPTFVRYMRRVKSGEGPLWERLLDQRIPPDRSIAEEVRVAACALRRAEPDIGVSATRKNLKRRFGAEGNVSNTWLRRVWQLAGLNRPPGAHAQPPEDEEIEYFSGGGGLALLAAAEAETGATRALAKATLEHASAVVEAQPADKKLVLDHDDRNEKGQFTPAYNERRRAGVAAGEADDRWAVDQAKAGKRDLTTLRLPGASEAVVAAKILAMGVTPLLTERRGFQGLDAPSGEWLGLLGGHAYMPATLDKALAELGLLAAGEAMWQAHAQTWHRLSQRWQEKGEAWQRSVIYIDGTADPDWSRAYSRSGKVSRLGRVMPCLSRVAIHSGAGVPLLVETHAGSAPLRKRLLPMLTKLDSAIGPEAQVQRVTVIDSEAGFAGFLWEMHQSTTMLFVTVIKGAVAKGAEVISEGPWQPYRQRDQLRELEVRLRGTKAPEEGIVIRVVEMARESERHARSTLFATNAALEDMPTQEVADIYLRRWPCQEAQFRRGRDGGGLNRSHGYGAAFVENVALQNKQEKADAAVKRAANALAKAEENQAAMQDGLSSATASVRKHALKLGQRDVAAKARALAARKATRDKLASHPTLIRVRDTTRDSVATCVKLNMLSLLEFTLQEYFGGGQMSWRVFIEQFVSLPVTVRSSETRCVYQLHANRRQPARMAALAAALAEVTRRRLVRGKQLLEFELLGFKRRGGSSP